MANETVSLSHLCLFGGKEDHIASREVKHFIHLLAKIDQYQTSRGYYDVLRSLVNSNSNCLMVHQLSTQGNT